MSVRLSGRLPPHGETNRITQLHERLVSAGVTIADLTESNPTRVGFDYPAGLVRVLSDPASTRYAPEPLGLGEARRAVALDASRRRVTVEPDRVVLSASSSESYSWLFKLFCNPGDRVLVPQPSYPLFEHLAALESVAIEPYALAYHGRWEVDLESVRHGLAAGARMIVAVSPNNPTGSCLSPAEADALITLAAEAGVPLVVDEVFADYLLAPGAGATDIACRADGRSGALVVTLGGLSKSVGLPQLKLGWMVLGGDPASVRVALAGLELIADSYLSVSTPVQLAAAALLTDGAAVRTQIQARIATNLEALRAEVARCPSCDVLPVEGGWSAVVRVPATRSEEALVLALLEQAHVLVHPGYFFDFAHEAFVVVSLLPPEAEFGAALRRVLQVAAG